MTDDQHGETSRGGGRWDPLPQGDYDDGATAFVKLPEGGIEALLAERDSPLAAPGHGYVPPQITVTPESTAGTDPAATGSWAVPAEAVQWPDPNALPQEAAHDRFSYHPAATGQWDFAEAPQDGAVSGRDVTGQWSIPVVGGDLPDESGEFTTSSLVEQWGGTPPATLPGGAPAPWATEAAGQPWSPEPEAPAEPHAMRAPEAPADLHAVRATDAPADPHAVRAADAAAQPSAGTHPEPRAEAAHEASEPPHEAPGAAGAPDAAVRAPEPEPVAAESTDNSGTPGTAPEESPAPEAPDAAEASGTSEGAAPARPALDEHPLASYVLRVNGADRPVTDAWVGESLLYVLRERLGLAGAKDGCSQGECGACNVQVDGRLVASCLVPAVTASGSEVRTVEGLAADGQPSDVQRALAKCGAVQCGFCVPGMAMTVHDLLEGNPAPTELETRQALCGNLCRCSGYRGVLEAVREVVAEREAHTAAAAESAPDAEEARIPHQAGPGAGSVNPAAYEASAGPPASAYGDTSPYAPQEPHEQPYGQDGGQA